MNARIKEILRSEGLKSVANLSDEQINDRTLFLMDHNTVLLWETRVHFVAGIVKDEDETRHLVYLNSDGLWCCYEGSKLHRFGTKRLCKHAGLFLASVLLKHENNGWINAWLGRKDSLDPKKRLLFRYFTKGIRHKIVSAYNTWTISGVPEFPIWKHGFGMLSAHEKELMLIKEIGDKAQRVKIIDIFEEGHPGEKVGDHVELIGDSVKCIGCIVPSDTYTHRCICGSYVCDDCYSIIMETEHKYCLNLNMKEHQWNETVY